MLCFHTDIDECVEETDNCDDNAACTNTEGSFTCLCEPGFGGDGVQCEGKSLCDSGYSGNGAVCTGELLYVVCCVYTSYL